MSDSLTMPQVAARLGRSRITVWRHIKAQRERGVEAPEVVPGVRVFRIGSADLVSKIQLEEFLSTGRVAS